jgi:hypothetical protein
MRRFLLTLVMVGMIGGLALAACGTSGPTEAGSGSTSSVPPTSSSSTTTTARGPSALDQLGGYFEAADQKSRLLQTAANKVNGDIRAGSLAVSPATAAAVAAADPTSIGATIPAGVPEGLLQQVMLVQSDLMSRWASLHGYARLAPSGSTTTIPRSDPSAQMALRCLANGGAAATSFSGNLAAARSAAATSPPVTVAAPDSRDAANVAILLQELSGLNLGCASCGGERYTTLPTITWYPARVPAGATHPGPVDGTVNNTEFMADYVPGTGWQILLYAC